MFYLVTTSLFSDRATYTSNVFYFVCLCDMLNAQITLHILYVFFCQKFARGGDFVPFGLAVLCKKKHCVNKMFW